MFSARIYRERTDACAVAHLCEFSFQLFRLLAGKQDQADPICICITSKNRQRKGYALSPFFLIAQYE